MTGRLSFVPTRASREYFDELVRRLSEERDIDARVTQREAFEKMVEYARAGEHPRRANLLRMMEQR
jgi:hypothetical protein